MRITALIGVFSATALAGINCRGSFSCFNDVLEELEQALSDAVVRGFGATFYETEEKIACADWICAFFEAGANGTLWDADEHVRNLQDHGCKACGSDPTNPGSDGSNGRLTVNFVDHPGCEPGYLCFFADNTVSHIAWIDG